MKPLKTYTVTFQERLWVRVTVDAASPEDAETAAEHIWSDDLWQTLEPALATTASEILESQDRLFFEVEEDWLTNADDDPAHAQEVQS